MTWFNDTFTESATTALTSHTSDSGGTWSLWGGATPAPNIHSTLGGVVASGSASAQLYRASAIATNTDCEIDFSLNVGSNSSTGVTGACARLDAVGNVGYFAGFSNYMGTGVWYIARISSGMTFTVLNQEATSHQLTNGANYAGVLTVTGSGASVVLSLKINGTQVANYTDTSGSRITAAGYTGVYFSTPAGAASTMFLGSLSGADSSTPAANITMTGPASGASGVASGNFTVGADGAITGTVVVTLSDSSAGGTFTPTTVSISSGTPTQTFTYTPVSAGAKTISNTNNGSLGNSATITYTVSATTALAAPVDGAIFPLSSGITGTASVPFSGTYSGTAPDQWQVVLDSDHTTAVAVTGGTGWQSFASAPSAGAFSQTVAGLPKLNGWYNVQVRNSGTPGTVYTSGKIGAGCLVAVDGQSNAWYWFSANANGGDSSLTPNALIRVTGHHATTPNTSWDVPAASTMNASIACGNALATALSCPIGLVDGSWDASSLTQSSGSGADGASTGWVVSGAAGSCLTASDASVAAAGGKLIGTIWIQGEGDAGAGVSQSTYYTALGQMIGIRRTAVSDANNPYVIATLARNLAGMSDTYRENIKQAQVQKCADAHIYRVDRLDLPLQGDGVHHTAPGFTALGQRCAQAILYAVGNVAHYRGPQMASVAATTTTTVFDVTLTHDMGTDFTPTSGITGFRALDSGTPISVSSAVRQKSNQIRLTLATAPSALPVIEYLYGSAPTITGISKDNGTLTLPLEYNSGVTAHATTRGTSTLTTNGSTNIGAVTGLLWAWYDTPEPDFSIAPTCYGTTSTNSSGVLDVALTGSTLAAGQTGFLIVVAGDGNPGSAANYAASGPVAAS